MQLSFKQNLPQTEISVSKKTLKTHLNPKFFFGIAFIFVVIFLGIIFNLDKKESKEQKNKTKLENLKTKIKNGESLEENEKIEFCNLLWVIEGVAIDNCENLSVEQYAKFVKEYKMYQFLDEKILRKRFEVDDFERLKKDEILPKYYHPIRVKDNIKKYLKDSVNNPNVGYWGKDEYFVWDC